MTCTDTTSGGDGQNRWLASARAALPSLSTEAYLNTGGAGPLPTPAVEAMRQMITLQAGRGRMSSVAVDAGRQRQAAVRSAVGRVLGRPAGEIAIAQSSTHAMNAVIWGLDLAPGDELVTTGMEHPGLVVPLAAAARRSGAVLRVVDVGDGSGDLEEAMRSVCSPRTRLVALSHVSWLTGAVLDIRGAATAAHEVGAVVLVDGAQAAGAIAVDPVALGVDAYALPAQKWLMGGTGRGRCMPMPVGLRPPRTPRSCSRGGLRRSNGLRKWGGMRSTRPPSPPRGPAGGRSARQTACRSIRP